MSGVAKTKAALSERAQSGDRTARQLLNAIGNFEQGKYETPPFGVTEQKQECSILETAGLIHVAFNERKKTLLAERLVGELIERDMTVSAALETLMT